MVQITRHTEYTEDTYQGDLALAMKMARNNARK